MKVSLQLQWRESCQSLLCIPVSHCLKGIANTRLGLVKETFSELESTRFRCKNTRLASGILARVSAQVGAGTVVVTGPRAKVSQMFLALPIDYKRTLIKHITSCGVSLKDAKVIQYHFRDGHIVFRFTLFLLLSTSPLAFFYFSCFLPFLSFCALFVLIFMCYADLVFGLVSILCLFLKKALQLKA